MGSARATAARQFIPQLEMSNHARIAANSNPAIHTAASSVFLVFDSSMESFSSSR
jgi:hypothetical protein